MPISASSLRVACQFGMDVFRSAQELHCYHYHYIFDLTAQCHLTASHCISLHLTTSKSLALQRHIPPITQKSSKKRIAGHSRTRTDNLPRHPARRRLVNARSD
jgi:hypothetical protein